MTLTFRHRVFARRQLPNRTGIRPLCHRDASNLAVNYHHFKKHAVKILSIPALAIRTGG